MKTVKLILFFVGTIGVFALSFLSGKLIGTVWFKIASKYLLND